MWPQDGNGGIDKEELIVALTEIGFTNISAERAAAFFAHARYDADHSGVLEIDEFRLLVADLQEARSAGSADPQEAPPSMDVVQMMRERVDTHLAPGSALSEALAAASKRHQSSPALAALPSPRTAMRRREEERQRERDKEAHKQQQQLAKLQELQAQKNEGLKVKEAQQRAKKKKQEAATQRAKEEAAAHHLQTMIAKDASLGEEEFKRRVEPIFRKMDVDRSGAIDIDELRKVMAALKMRLTEEQLAGMMAEADTSGDHTIDLDEFAAILRKQATQGSGAWVQIKDEGRGFMGLGSWLSPASATSAATAAGSATAAATDAASAHTETAAVSARGLPTKRPSLPRPSSTTATSPGATPRATSPATPDVGKLSSGRYNPTIKTGSSARAGKAGTVEQAAPAPPPLSSKEAILRAKLKHAFATFDADGSGTISSSEMAKVLKLCGIQKSPKELKALMIEADPDGSGEIDFEEFASVLKRQAKAGGGQLASAIAEAGSLFGWLDPFSWFGPSKEDQDAEQRVVAAESACRSPVEAYGGGTWSFGQPWSPPTSPRTGLYRPEPGTEPSARTPSPRRWNGQDLWLGA